MQKLYEGNALPEKLHVVDSLVLLALRDYVREGICKFCKGSGETLTNGLITPCRAATCNEGHTYYRDFEKAKKIGVSAKEFERKYRDTYKLIERCLAVKLPNCESEALEHIRRQSQWRDADL